MPYPEDVTKALAYAADAGWTRERYQAILGLALHHLDKPERPEIHVMWAEEAILITTFTSTGAPTEVKILGDSIYFACPVCRSLTQPTFVTDAVESASVDYEEDEDGGVYVSRHGWDTSADGEGWFTCSTVSCYAELGIPEWLDFND